MIAPTRSLATLCLLLSSTALRTSAQETDLSTETPPTTGPVGDTEEGEADVYCLTMHEDLVRRQATEWGSLVPFTMEDGTKHTPFVEFDASTRQATVIIGNGDDVGGVYHPMVASDYPATVHFITYVYVVDQSNHLFAVKTMDPTMPAPATVVFDVPLGVTEVTAYEFCNLHGLWKGPSISAEASSLGDSDAAIMADVMSNSNTTTTTTSPGLAARSGGGNYCVIDSPLDVAFGSYNADFVRRQSLPPFNSLDPYDEEDGAKHVPYTNLNDDGTATVTVGVEGNFHVMFGASSVAVDDGYDNTDNSEPHWITEVYVVDQHGAIISMESLNPTGVDKAQITFDIPVNATTLTAYEWCNIHGLYVGPTISVATGERVVEDAEDAGGASSGNRMWTISGIAGLLSGLFLVALA